MTDKTREQFKKRNRHWNFLSKPDFPKKVSEETENIFNDPLTFLAQEICDETLVPQELCPYSDQELETAESLRTLKCRDLRTNGHFTRICTEPQEPQELLGLR